MPIAGRAPTAELSIAEPMPIAELLNAGARRGPRPIAITCRAAPMPIARTSMAIAPIEAQTAAARPREAAASEDALGDRACKADRSNQNAPGNATRSSRVGLPLRVGLLSPSQRSRWAARRRLNRTPSKRPKAMSSVDRCSPILRPRARGLSTSKPRKKLLPFRLRSRSSNRWMSPGTCLRWSSCPRARPRRHRCSSSRTEQEGAPSPIALATKSSHEALSSFFAHAVGRRTPIFRSSSVATSTTATSSSAAR